VDTLDAFEPKKMTAEAMVNSEDADEGEKLAQSDNIASKFDAALREILDIAAANNNILEQTTRLLEHDTTKASKAELTTAKQEQCVPRSQIEEIADMIDNPDDRHDTLCVLENSPEASRNQQRISGSMVLQEEDDSKLSKKFAAKSAANPLGIGDIKLT
jgi:hypothetical protein